jgi:twitching motility protein PilT
MIDMRQVFDLAIEHAASDIVLTRGAAIAYKINGRWATVNADPLTHEAVKALVYSLLGNDQIARFERQRELDFSFEVEQKERDLSGGGESGRSDMPPKTPPRYRYRGNAFFQRGSPGAVLRLIPKEIPSFEQLGLPPIFETFALEPQGLVLITGPTGHGKTTTCAAMIDTINRNRRCHIVTIEDPIEYVHRNKSSIIEQREVGEDTPSFATALRHVLRQAPDVILIGELRDQETFAAALTAAETGHLVLATLHTNDCVKTIDRIVDAFPPHQQSQVRAQLALTLTAIASQRLIPTQDNKGRVLAIELLVNNTAIANLIREQKIYQIYSVMETASKEGMMTMDASITKLYQAGKISLAEAKLRMKSPQTLELRKPETSAAPASPPAEKARGRS